MHLYDGLGDADVTGNLFAEATARDLNHDLTLSGTQKMIGISLLAIASSC